ncbi:MAG: alpha/beta hydrolase [Bacteroidota bacterium]
MEAINRIEFLDSFYPKAALAPRPRVPFSVIALRWYFQTLGRLSPRLSGHLAYKLFTTPNKRAKHRSSDMLLEQARIFEFLYGGHLLKAYEWGQGDRVILLVHGWESRGTALRSFVPPLLRRGYRVVAFDGPAHGNSGGKRTNLPHFGGAIRALINRIGGVSGIIAHSFGGASTMFTLANLDNSITVEKMVMIGVPGSLKNVLSQFSGYLHIPQSISNQVARIVERKINGPLDEAHVGKISERAKVGQTLIIHDKMDNIVPFTEAENNIQHWEKAQLLVTEGYGHYKLMKNPDVVSRVVNFLTID